MKIRANFKTPTFVQSLRLPCLPYGMPLKLYSIGVECEAYSSGVMWYIPHGGAQILILEIFYIFTKALT